MRVNHGWRTSVVRLGASSNRFFNEMLSAFIIVLNKGGCTSLLVPLLYITFEKAKSGHLYTIIFIFFFLSSGLGCSFFSFSSSAFACVMVFWSFSSHSSRVFAYDNIIFCWVMHEQSIIDDILSRLDHKDCKVYCVSLVCDPDVLSERLRKDIEQGVRLPSIIEKSISYLPKYRLLYTKRIDVSNSSPNQIADEIAAL